MIKTNKLSFTRTKTFLILIGFFLFVSANAHAAGTVNFKVTLDPAAAVSSQPISGRLLIFMRKDDGKPNDGFGADFSDPNAVWISGTEITNLEAGKNIEIDPDVLAFPSRFSAAPAGEYQIFALLDRDHSYTYSGPGSGDIVSTVV